MTYVLKYTVRPLDVGLIEHKLRIQTSTYSEWDAKCNQIVMYCFVMERDKKKKFYKLFPSVKGRHQNYPQ